MDCGSSDISFVDPVERLKNSISEDLNLYNPVQLDKIKNEDELTKQVISHQNHYIKQLETETIFLREQLSTIKQNIYDVIQENEDLRQNSNDSVITLIKEKLHNISAEVKLNEVEKNSEKSSINSEREIWNKWQNELERIRHLYKGTSERMEEQVNSFRNELLKKNKEVEDLKLSLRGTATDNAINTANPVNLPSLCFTCGDKEAIIFPSSSFRSKEVACLSKDKDELSVMLAKTKQKLQVALLREEECHEQVKKSVQLVDQVQFEKVEVDAENYHLKQDMEREKHRIQLIIDEYKENLKKERDLITCEWSKRFSALQEKLTKTNSDKGDTVAKLEQSERGKESIQKKLNSTQEQLGDLQQEMIQAKNNMVLERQQMKIDKDEISKQVRTLLSEKEQFSRLHKQEVESLHMKIDVLERNLDVTERRLNDSNHECLTLTKTITNLEKQANLAKLSKESIERSRTDDVKTLSQQSELKEQQLQKLIQDMQLDFARKISMLDEIISSQNSLINKMKDECYVLTSKLEQVTEQNGLERQTWLQEKGRLISSLQVSFDRLGTLEMDQTDKIQEESKLKLQVTNLKELSLKNTNQIYELVQKQVMVDHERNHLRNEIQFLQSELLNMSSSRD